MKLDLYHKKRNFKKTPEPKGKITRVKKHLFVIQKHAASHLHYDFRLELNGVLLSWAVPKGPCLDPTVKRLAMHVEDHPVEYGHFEGIIPKGEYGGGTVMVWDIGKWIPEDENPDEAYHKGHLRFTLKAKKLNGRWSLIRFKKDEKAWFLVKGNDEYARKINKFDVTVEEPNSVISGRSLEEIAENYDKVWSKNGLVKKNREKINNKKIKINLPPSAMSDTIYPQLATLVDEPPNGKDWLHEIKYDGYRILAFKKNKRVKLISRNNKDWTKYFRNIIDKLEQLPIENAIFDGEVVILDKHQHSDFQMLQNAINSNQNLPFVYYIFDLIYYDKYNLMNLPLVDRKDYLKNILSANDSVLRYSDHIIGSGSDVFKKSCQMGLEGIVSKKANSKYVEKRTRNWVKAKCTNRQEFVIGGFSHPKGSRHYFGSLYLGYFDNKGVLKFCGNVGTGFNANSLKSVFAKLEKNITARNPFNAKPPGHTTAIWVKPNLVAEVEFSEWTEEGILRHPSFKGLRSDKPASSIRREKP